MNLDEYDLINLLMKHLDDLSQEHMGVRMAPTLDTRRMSGLAPHEGSSAELHLGVDPCQGSSLSPPSHRMATSRGLQKW